MFNDFQTFIFFSVFWKYNAIHSVTETWCKLFEESDNLNIAELLKMVTEIGISMYLVNNYFVLQINF